MKIIKSKKTMLISLMLITITIFLLSFNYNKNDNSIIASNINPNFSFSVNGKNGNKVLVNQNDITMVNITITSLVNKKSEYKLYYEVCNNEKCNNIHNDDQIEVRYASSSIDSISGNITPYGSKIIKLVVINHLKDDQFIRFNLESDKNKNSAYSSEITEKYEDTDYLLAAYIDGDITTTFPTTNEYSVAVKCTANGNVLTDAVAAVSWVNNKYIMNVKNIKTSGVRCNANFVKGIPANWNSASVGTFLYAIKNTNTLTEPFTIPGKQKSSSDEAVFAVTEDDYGASYYFRGNVQNNYVSFANMCWRIVRITGDGNVKLVLYNEENSSCTTEKNFAAYARYSGTQYLTLFNNNYNDNAYVGFMYGSSNSNSFENTHANVNKSTILTNLENWYSLKLSSYTNKLADVIWCGDKSIGKVKESVGIKNKTTKYGAKSRQQNSSPSFVCPDLICPSEVCPNGFNNPNLSKYTVSDTTNGNGALTYPIGLLTLDETIYAGIHGIEANTSVYLYSNTGGLKGWWTMSPGKFSTMDTAQVFAITAVGFIDAYRVDYTYLLSADIALRPSIAIKGDAIVTGTGTNIDPFVVQ